MLPTERNVSGLEKGRNVGRAAIYNVEIQSAVATSMDHTKIG